MLMPNMLLPASIKLRCVCSDLPDLLAQIARRLQLPADIRVSHPVAKGEQPSPIVEFGVSRAFPSWNRSILTEIYLCHTCSYHEIEDGNGAWAGPGRAAARGF